MTLQSCRLEHALWDLKGVSGLPQGLVNEVSSLAHQIRTKPAVIEVMEIGVLNIAGFATLLNIAVTFSSIFYQYI